MEAYKQWVWRNREYVHSLGSLANVRRRFIILTNFNTFFLFVCFEQLFVYIERLSKIESKLSTLISLMRL